MKYSVISFHQRLINEDCKRIMIAILCQLWVINHWGYPWCVVFFLSLSLFLSPLSLSLYAKNPQLRKSTIWKARIKKKDEILWRQEYWKERTIILIFSITATTLMGCDTIEINQIFRPKRIKYSVANLIFLDLNFESWHIGAALLHKNGVPKRRNFCAKFSRRIHFHQILVVWESLSRDF